jgi:hypothetical protein
MISPRRSPEVKQVLSLLDYPSLFSLCSAAVKTSRYCRRAHPPHRTGRIKKRGRTYFSMQFLGRDRNAVVFEHQKQRNRHGMGEDLGPLGLSYSNPTALRLLRASDPDGKSNRQPTHAGRVHPGHDEFSCNGSKKTFSKILAITQHDQEKIACPHCCSTDVEQRRAAFTRGRQR